MTCLTCLVSSDGTNGSHIRTSPTKRDNTQPFKVPALFISYLTLSA